MMTIEEIMALVDDLLDTYLYERTPGNPVGRGGRSSMKHRALTAALGPVMAVVEAAVTLCSPTGSDSMADGLDIEDERRMDLERCVDAYLATSRAPAEGGPDGR